MTGPSRDTSGPVIDRGETMSQNHRFETLQLHAGQEPAPGTLDANLNITCGRNALKIAQIKPEGSRLMDFKAFVNGRNTRPGDAFVRIDG